MNATIETYDAVIIGGGLGGLTAAALLAEKGKRVLLVEQKNHLGGRASSTKKDGFVFNQGAHALYKAGPAAHTFSALGIHVEGGSPADDLQGYTKGKLGPLPTGLPSLVKTNLLGMIGKTELASFLGNLGSKGWEDWDKISASELLGRHLKQPDSLGFVQALARLTTYCDAPDTLSAAALLGQLKSSTKGGVVYLNGGWQSLVDGLVAKLESLKVEMLLGHTAEVLTADGKVTGVKLDSGETKSARSVVVVSGPKSARAILGTAGDALATQIDALIPVKAACLDVALSKLPNPGCKFILDIDSPRYFSLHSEFAELAPKGAALMHLMQYLKPGEENDAQATRANLEQLLDIAQPGWRDVLVEARFMPEMVVAFGYPDVRTGGLKGRPSVAVPGCANLFVAGDWVGDKHMLLDASIHSVQQATNSILGSELVEQPAPAAVL